MCGINGIFAYDTHASAVSEVELIRTRDRMSARGPDGSGIWWSGSRRLGLGHRRLAIQDLSVRSAQPMVSADGRYVITFNGEIYNAPQLRSDLQQQGVVFRGSSDTEVLLALFACVGSAALSMLQGMFAFGIWDERAHRLFLARDPYGIKPLYTVDDGCSFRFASQVKALVAGGGVSRSPEPAGIVGFLLWGSVPDPFTLYEGVRALPAGHFQWIDESGPQEPVSYFSIPETLAQAETAPIRGAAVAMATVGSAVRRSVERHCLADVDVGVFLSAGVDSAAILGVMRDLGVFPLTAVTLAFEEFRGTTQDEAPLASEIARYYGASHVIRKVTQAEFDEDLPDIFESMDQPSVDGINTWFVSKAAKEAGFKVAMSGVGGDELMGGYPSFRDIPRAVHWTKFLSAISLLRGPLQIALEVAGALMRKPKFAGLLENGRTYAGAYFLRRGLFLPSELRVHLPNSVLVEGLHRLENLERVRQNALHPDIGNPVLRITALESTGYLRHQLLRDADWAGMAHGVEIRTPLVDAQLLREVAPSLGLLGTGYGKRSLATIPTRPVPARVVTRPKTGFGIPVAGWTQSGVARRWGSEGLSSRSWARAVLAAQMP